jgi:CGNR zinc finger
VCLALQVLDLLQSPHLHLHLLRRCHGPGCGWLFLDRTRSHTRRWCSSSDCGNRARARRHYARHRDQPPPKLRPSTARGGLNRPAAGLAGSSDNSAGPAGRIPHKL